MAVESMTADLGLRARKKLETRRLIRRVTLDLSLEHGLEDLTVEGIAERAGISPRTFFNYFTHKEDALVTDASVAAESIRRHVIERPAHETPLHAIRATVTEHDFFALMNSDRDRMLVRQQLVREHPSLLARQLNQHALIEQAITEAVAHRTGTRSTDDLRPALIASVAGAAVRVALQRWSAAPAGELGDLLTAAFDLLEQGLLTAGADTDTDAGADHHAPEGGHPDHE